MREEKFLHGCQFKITKNFQKLTLFHKKCKLLLFFINKTAKTILEL